MRLVFATNNKHKLDEVRAILGGKIELLSLNDINCHDDIPETADTLQGNALIKARYIYDKFGINCFADDTGLEVYSLGGEPGVYSARYAGEECNPQDNMNKLLDNLTNFMMDNISNITSVRNITNSLNRIDNSLNHKTIGSYIDYLCNKDFPLLNS